MQTLILGIDALDPHFIEKFLPTLPTFQRLRQTARWHVVRCDAEDPNSPAGWSTIYSGVPASEHGITDWDYITENTGDSWRGTAGDLPRRFWEELNKAGLSVGLMCPPMVWPAPDLNGWAVGGFPTPYQFPRSIASYGAPDEQYSDHRIKALEPLGHVVDAVQYVDNTVEDYDVKDIQSLPMIRLEYALRAFRLLPVDVGFVFFSYLDRLGHMLNEQCWREKVITPAEAEDRMHWAYKKVDRLIALALAATNPGRVVICGDHGFNFALTTPAFRKGKVNDDPRFMGHTWETTCYVSGEPGQGPDLELKDVYQEIMTLPDAEIIKGKLRSLGYIE